MFLEIVQLEKCVNEVHWDHAEAFNTQYRSSYDGSRTDCSDIQLMDDDNAAAATED